MTVAVIDYHRDRDRWQSSARGGLAQAALRLYAKQGYEQTTVTEIARLAGLTERMFVRNFAHKREVLFYGTEMAQGHLVRSVANAPASATPMDAVSAALETVGGIFQENPECVRLRDAVVSANAELRERELIKLAGFAIAVAGALRDCGVPEPATSLTAETRLAVFKVAVARWVLRSCQPDLPGILREAMEELRGVLANRAPRDHNRAARQAARLGK